MDAKADRYLHAALTSRRNGEMVAIDLTGADLSGLTLPAGDLVQAALSGANLTNATLAGAKMGKAQLCWARFVDANLSGADLTRADLSRADLTGASLGGAIFTGANLRGACLLGVCGEPLSWSGASIDREMLERSEFSDEDERRLIADGALLDQYDIDSILGTISPPKVSLSRPPHILALFSSEVTTRERYVDEDSDETPASLRAYLQLTALISEARTVDAAPPSARGRLPTLAQAGLGGYSAPQIGEVFLGVTLEEQVNDGTVARTFRGKNGDGLAVIVRVFDPEKYGAPMQFPAFRRGLRALNTLQGLEPRCSVAEVLAVSCDLSAYVVREYTSGNLEDLVQVSVRLGSALTLFRTLALVVDRLHQEGLLLRALKPSSIVFDGLTPVLCELDHVDSPTLAQFSGDLAGYGAYAAPEEILGTGTLSPTADIFALGRILEYLVTGEEPSVALGGQPSVSFRKDVPAALSELVRRATALDPIDRYQYVGDLLEDLQQINAGAVSLSRASVRPAIPSRLDQRQLSQRPPALRQAPVVRKPVALREPVRSSESTWLSRGTELGLAAMGTLLGLALFIRQMMVPSPIQSAETRLLVAAVFVGLLAWVLPKPARAVAYSRFGTWFALAGLLAMLAPERASIFAYRRALARGSVEQKQRVVPWLTQLGFRDFHGAQLAGVNIFREDLAITDMRGANLSNANLSGSTLNEAKLDGAQLGGAVFRGSDLRGANLASAHGYEKAVCDDFTRLDAAFSCQEGRLAPRVGAE